LDWWAIVPEEFDRLKELEDEIRHFRHITVMLKEISDLKNKLMQVRQYQDPIATERMLKERFERGEITLDEYTEAIKQTARMVKEERFEYDGKRIVIKHIAQHYYLPVVLSEDEKVDYIRHIIKTPSEVRFINALERYLSQPNNKFGEFDWWFFSKLDESLDEVYLPYYDPDKNRIARFKPDFIFWLKKGNRYFIVFVDPKGTEHIDWQRKVDGYRAVFEDNGLPRVLSHDGWEVTVHLLLHTKDVNKLTGNDRRFWFDKVEKIATLPP
ncbi:MAG: restriction endonuclease subunit R, partial [Armatimonadetes bacterium]|nr:restriction endonuclease subunit R [Armatimonadota bacterium]